jgi:hypothetical protein
MIDRDSELATQIFQAVPAVPTVPPPRAPTSPRQRHSAPTPPSRLPPSQRPPGSSLVVRSSAAPTPEPRARVAVLVAAVAAGTLVSVGLGVFGRLHEATFAGLGIAGFSSGTAAKSWAATGVFALVLVQLGSAVLMSRSAALWPATLHRWSGRAAALATVPIAVHCLYALGFQLGSTRVLAHSLAGCLFYGVFVTKMLVLPRAGMPRWSIPLLGGLLFTALTAVWVTSAVWFFTTSGFVF